jgi:hypothetical protein
LDAGWITRAILESNARPQTPVDCDRGGGSGAVPGTNSAPFGSQGSDCAGRAEPAGGAPMHGIIYLIGLIVVIMAILSFFGLR